MCSYAVSGGGLVNDETRCAYSPVSPSGWRLVARMWSCGQDRSKASASCAQASMRCSQLSRSKRARQGFSLSTSASESVRLRDSGTPTIRASVGSTRADRPGALARQTRLHPGTSHAARPPRVTPVVSCLLRPYRAASSGVPDRAALEAQQVTARDRQSYCIPKGDCRCELLSQASPGAEIGVVRRDYPRRSRRSQPGNYTTRLAQIVHRPINSRPPSKRATSALERSRLVKSAIHVAV